MMTDQYKEQYKKEIEQIHAPAELIARTKAAMRAEEARIHAKGFNVRKWAYPLAAAAALLILVSVSMMMKGVRSRNMFMSKAPSSDTAMEMEASEVSGGADGGMAAAGAAMDMLEDAEVAEETPADEMMFAEADMAAAPAAENEVSDKAGFLEDAVAEKAESKETVKNEGQRKFGETEKSMAEDAAAPAESGAQSGGAAETGSITIEKVVKKPDFCGRSDTGTHVFEGQAFQVAEEDNGWAAYAETKDGNKYVIRGEAEDLETFLEMGYRKLSEGREN